MSIDINMKWKISAFDFLFTSDFSNTSDGENLRLSHKEQVTCLSVCMYTTVARLLNDFVVVSKVLINVNACLYTTKYKRLIPKSGL